MFVCDADACVTLSECLTLSEDAHNCRLYYFFISSVLYCEWHFAIFSCGSLVINVYVAALLLPADAWCGGAHCAQRVCPVPVEKLNREATIYDKFSGRCSAHRKQQSLFVFRIHQVRGHASNATIYKPSTSISNALLYRGDNATMPTM